LSINASIEASNAGAAGKGFAVISSAIRDLATKSGSATSEIEETSARTAKTIGSIRQASEAVDESILTVCNYIDEITAAINAVGI
jgi:methyl-accepting chemotaxis protein